jgi:hypothetical protein
MILDIPDGDPKTIREALCMAQAYLRADNYIRNVQKIIDAIDILRPLGPDGKHEDRHTPYCGCEDGQLPDPEKIPVEKTLHYHRPQVSPIPYQCSLVHCRMPRV